MIFKNIFKKQNNNSKVYLVGTHRGEVSDAVTVAVFQNETDAESYITEDLGFNSLYGGDIYVIEEDGERSFANITEADVQ